MENPPEDSIFEPNTPDDIHLFACYLKMMEEGDITLQEVVILSLIQSRANKNQDCYYSNATLARKLAISEPRVRVILKRLKKKKYIDPVYDGKRFLYKKGVQKHREK